jgi:hypothetical protein
MKKAEKKSEGKTKVKSKVEAKAKNKDIASSYNRYKIFNGKQYTGMAIGRRHKWYYDKGIWLDKKITPDKWLINFEVTKRRAGKAPEGSGVPVGTEYHWYILAHQMVKKLNANDYSTAMNGYKFKVAHKRADKDKWSISDSTQKKHLIKILKEFIDELESESVEEFVEGETNVIKSPKKKTAKEKVPAKKKVRELELEEA